MAAVKQIHTTPVRKPKAKSVRVSDLSQDAAQLLQELEIWLLAHRGLAPTTVTTRVGCCRRIIGVLGLNPGPTQIERYIGELRQTGVAYGTVYTTMQSAEELLAFLGTPVHFTRPRKPARTPKDTLSETEIALIIHHAKDLRERALLTLLAYAGIRNAEFCKLRIEDVHLAECYVQVIEGKALQNYKAAFTGECAKVVSEYIGQRRAEGAADNDLLFVTRRHGYELEQQDLRKIVRVAVRRADIKKPVSPHLFRHSLAMNMLNRGANLMTIQKQLGHGWVQTTLEYLRGEYTRGQHEYPLNAPRYI